METSGLIYGLYRFCVWTMKLFATNILWLLFNIPIAYLSFNLILSKTPQHLQINFITLAALAPFIFFPATTALFGVIRKWVTGESDIPLVRSFVKYYKDNYIRSMTIGFIIVPLWGVLIVDYFYFSNANSPLFYVFLLIGMFMFVFTFHLFSNTVHVHLKYFNAFKNSMLLTIGRPVHTIGIAVANAGILYVCFNVFPPLILLGMGTLIAFTSFYLYYKSHSYD
ncbi:YesL family protein [Bacillus sp. FSL K6-3431]|uniref:YesL family protein n=1 Tax=Bacillus sp. FSL K6-3431 TaxID=2921500 RepID=UPI0030F7E2B1